jgi:hypothetical protein
LLPDVDIDIIAKTEGDERGRVLIDDEEHSLIGETVRSMPRSLEE